MQPITRYKYNYHYELKPKAPLKTILSIVFVVTMLLLIAFTIFWTGSVSASLPIIIPTAMAIFFLQSALGTKKAIDFYPRFITIGTVVIYFENITDIDKSLMNEGLAVLHYDIGGKAHKFTIDQSLFPTDARKDYKIEANTRAKFEKTINRIEERYNALANASRLNR